MTKRFIKPVPTFVYFVYNPFRNIVKIGQSKRVRERFWGIRGQSADHLEIFGAVVDSGGLEKALHARFGKYLKRNEWFWLERPILQWLIEHKTQLLAGSKAAKIADLI